MAITSFCIRNAEIDYTHNDFHTVGPVPNPRIVRAPEVQKQTHIEKNSASATKVTETAPLEGDFYLMKTFTISAVAVKHLRLRNVAADIAGNYSGVGSDEVSVWYTYNFGGAGESAKIKFFDHDYISLVAEADCTTDDFDASGDIDVFDDQAPGGRNKNMVINFYMKWQAF